MEPTNINDSPTTPTTSRSAFMRHRKRLTSNPLTLLREPGIAQELRELEYDERNQASSSSIEADTSVGSMSQVSDDSGIDVSQDTGGAGHPYILRNRYSDSF